MLDSQKSQLEVALDHYDRQASRYYRQLKESDPDASDEVQKQRDAELLTAKKHLRQQRTFLNTMASIQCKLDEYREQGRQAVSGGAKDRQKGTKLLVQEEHHPTDDIEEFMIADGRPKPSSEHTAHHIVPGKGKAVETYQARVHMHFFGIRINDPDNGVWLPTYARYTPHWSMPEALGHLQYHTGYYEVHVSNRVRSKSSEVQIRNELKTIGKLMQVNKIPLTKPRGRK